MHDALLNVLTETTRMHRKGAPVKEEVLAGGMIATTFDAMPEAPAPTEGVALVDVHFMVVAVDLAKATAKRQDLVSMLPIVFNLDTLKGGPSYITLGAMIGDQGVALSLMALGHALGLWRVITPATLGMTGPMADDMAGRGFVMTDGFRP